MRLTREIIEKAKSERGGWTKKQFKIIGEDWPPQSGWKDRCVGNEISSDGIKKYIALRQNKRKAHLVLAEKTEKRHAERSFASGYLDCCLLNSTHRQRARRPIGSLGSPGYIAFVATN